jgi:hypothetical protein
MGAGYGGVTDYIAFQDCGGRCRGSQMRTEAIVELDSGQGVQAAKSGLAELGR